MKKSLLLFAAIVMANTGLWAQNYSVGDCFISGNLRYMITSLSPNIVEVTTAGINTSQHYPLTAGTTSVTIPGNVSVNGKAYAVTAIAGGSTSSGAFSQSTIETITFQPNSQVAEIGDYAFYKSSTTSITLPASLTTIGQRAFLSCAALQTVNLQEGLTTIGRSAFNGCKALQSITIPASVSSIGQSAFFGCTALAEVTVKWTDAASIPVPGTDAFGSIAEGAVLIVPAGTKDLYKAKGWGQWFTIIASGDPQPDECDPITEFPYFNDFENFLDEKDCWISIDADGDGEDWITGTTQSGEFNGYNSSTGLVSKSYDYYGTGVSYHANNYLLSPEFVLPAGYMVTLSWDAKSWYPSYPDHYEVMIAPNGSTDINDFVSVYNENGRSGWTRHSVDISAYAGTTVRVVFRHQDYDKYWILIDNLSIETTFDCSSGYGYPFVENFENCLDCCWGNFDEDGDGYTWQLAAGNQGNGAKSVSWSSPAGPLNPDNWLVSPEITIPRGLDEVTLAWKVKSGNGSYREHYAVYVSTTGNEPSDFKTQIYEGYSPESAAWTNVTVDMTAYAGQTVNVAFRHYNSPNMWDFTIDEISIKSPIQYNPITEFPYFNDFENFLDEKHCWIDIDNDGDGYGWITDTKAYGTIGLGVDGSHCLVSQSYDNSVGAFNADNYLLSPEVVLPANSTVTLSWYEKSQDPSYPDSYEVMIAPNGSTDISDFVSIYGGVAENPWTERTADLSAYAGTTVRVVFHHQSSDCYMLEIDNMGITVEAGPEPSGELTIYADATETQRCTPVYTFYGDTQNSAAQFVVPASLLTDMVGSQITSMKFYTNPAEAYQIQNISGPTYAGYMTEVQSETMSTFIDFNSATNIFNGNISLTDDCLIIDLVTPYTYNGGNLAIAFVCTQKASYCSVYYYSQAVTGGSIYRESGSGATVQNYIPKTTFTYTSGGPQPDECDPITEFPYFNDFEDFTVNHDCWISIDNDGDGEDWITGTAQSGMFNGYNSSTGLISKSYDYDGTLHNYNADNYLLSPEFVLPANKTVTLSWYVSSGYGPAYPDWYEVMIAPNGSTDIHDFVQILPEDGPSDWEQRTRDISAYAGTTVRVVFHHQDYAQYWIKIDNLGITVEGPEYDVMEITANQDPDHKTHYYSSFYSSKKAYSVPEGVTAYTGVVDGNVLKLTSITDGIIPAGEPVILRLTTAEDNTAATKQQIALTATTETGTKSTNNALTGTDVAKTLGANDYALSLGQNGVGFYKWKDRTIEAHKAYLTLEDNEEGNAKAFTFQFDDASSIHNSQFFGHYGHSGEQARNIIHNSENDVMYNLNGIRVDENYKGIVIRNGKKIYWRGQSEK